MPQHDLPIGVDIVEPGLLVQPTQRVGYSDRTAWLMATMSQLAYFEFENRKSITDIASDLAAITGQDEALTYLQGIKNILPGLNQGASGDRRKSLEAILKLAGFSLVDVFDAGGTQAFLAKKDIKDAGDGAQKMLVLAFRGTEKNIQDWKSNIRAKLVPAGKANRKGRIHCGFQSAYYNVEDKIEAVLAQHPDEPLYLTGHSLGGALAIIATRFMSSRRLAACYTFGSPRVGDLELADVFKTPIYRIVNSADAVPRLPFGYGYVIAMKVFRVVMMLLPTFKALERLYGYMDMIAGYVHYGDMRYLTTVEPGAADTYQGLRLISNPSGFFRLERLFKRVKATRGLSLIRDHASGLYRAKLRARALARN